MASISTHDAYKPGIWATETIKSWQLERAAGMRTALALMEKVGAEGALASERLHGFWWSTENPPEPKFWEKLNVPNSHSREGSYRSAVGRTGRAIWRPKRFVVHHGNNRYSPLYDEFHDIRFQDWWHLSTALGIRPMFWPAFGLFLMPELEVLGDYGEHVVVWAPKDRFGFSQIPSDCSRYTKAELKSIYENSWRDIKQPPVIQAYLGDEIKFKAEGKNDRDQD